jgi:predicted transcriptional regulator
MTTTTIKVSTETRDRINELAAGQGLTAGSMIEKVLDDYLWRQEVALAKQQMLDAPAKVWAAYLEETQTMDGSLADGLMVDPW